MASAMSSRIAVREIGFTLTLLLVSSAQAVDYELHRHDAISANWDDNVILTSRDFLEQLNFVAPKTSYTLQEATEHLLHFGALLRVRILDTFGSLLYDYYDDFGITEVEALHKVYREILERRYDVFHLIHSVLKNPDTRPSRICAEIYNHAMEPCLRSSASVCRRIRKQHDLPDLDNRNTLALNVTYRVYHLSKISKQYPRGFSLVTLLRLLQREVLMITPNLLSGLLYNVRYENYDDDVRLAERELIRHFREMSGTSEISVSIKELRKFHTMNSFVKYYIDIYAEKFPDNDLKKYALLIARKIADDIGTIDENIYLLGNVYENRTINVGYLFDLVLPDDLLENDVIEAKKYLVTKLNKFNVVERYLKVQKYQQVTPAQLTMEITRQLKDIDFAKNIATSLRMHAKFWRSSRMIESLDELLELFDTYENLRQVPRYLHMMQKIDKIKKSLRDMKDVPVEILCNAPRACLRIGLQLVLHCKFISSQIKISIKNFLQLSDVCVEPVYMIHDESRRSVEIPFKISKTRYSTSLQTMGTVISKATTRHSTIKDGDQSESESEEITESDEISNETTEVSTRPKISLEESSEFTSTTTPRTTTESISTRQKETTAAMTAITTPTTLSPTTITTLPTTATILPATKLSMTTLPTITTTLSSTTMLPTTITTLPTTISTTLPTTISTTLPTTTTTTLPTTTTTTLPTTTTTTLPTTTTTTLPTTTTTTLPTTTTTTLPTTTTTTLPTTTTTTLPTTTTTTLPTTTTTTLPTTITTTLPTTTTMVPTTTTMVPTTTTTTLPTTITTTLPTTSTTISPSTTLPTTTTTTSPTTISITLPTSTKTLSTTISTTLPTTTTTSATTTTTTLPIVTTDLPMVNVEMKLERSKIVKEVYVPYSDDKVTKPSTVSFTTHVPRPCESNECSEQSSEEINETTTALLSTTQSPTTPMMQTSTLEITRATSSEPSMTRQNFIMSKTIVSSRTKMSEMPIMKGDNCAKSCLEGCGSKSESVETSRRSCETSCDSVIEDCNGDDNIPKNSPELSSPECRTEMDRSCECATKEERSAECMTLCPSDHAESSSCEGVQSDCTTPTMPTFGMKLERTRTRSMCEIRNPHHRRQLRRLAKMRAISSAAAAVTTSHVNVPRLRTSRYRDRITTKKLYNLLGTKLPHSKSKRVEYLRKRPLDSRLSGNDRDRRHRKQREKMYKLKRRLTRKLGGKLTRKTTMHRTREITPFRHSQIKRISERGAQSISA